MAGVGMCRRDTARKPHIRQGRVVVRFFALAGKAGSRR